MPLTMRREVSPSPPISPKLEKRQEEQKAAAPATPYSSPKDPPHSDNPSQPSSSASSNNSKTYSINLPREVLTCIITGLADLEYLDSLSSLSLASKATHGLAAPALFHSVKIRNHHQLASILSSLETLDPDLAPGKRKTRLSGPKCNVEAKLSRFRLTKHLSINHFPSLENIARMAALQHVFDNEAIFDETESMTLAPILMHRLHPATCGAAAQLTKERLKGVHHLRILADPKHLIVDFRGSEADWASEVSLVTPHGCVCIDDFCGRLGRSWIERKTLKKLTIYLDPSILANHYLSTVATGPVLHVMLSSEALPQSSTSQPIRKRSRRSSQGSHYRTTPPTVLEALSNFTLNRVRQAEEHRGGKTQIHIPIVEGAEDVDQLVKAVLAGAKERAGDADGKMFEKAKAKAMLKGFHFNVCGDPSDE